MAGARNGALTIWMILDGPVWTTRYCSLTIERWARSLLRSRLLPRRNCLGFAPSLLAQVASSDQPFAFRPSRAQRRNLLTLRQNGFNQIRALRYNFGFAKITQGPMGHGPSKARPYRTITFWVKTPDWDWTRTR